MIAVPEPGQGLTKTLQAVVTVILPRYPDLDPGVRVAVERDVARYVAAFVRGVQSEGVLATLLAFDWLPLLFYGRPFRALPAARSARYLAWWNDAPILAMRDFVRLIRSSALLVYFDHPAVAQQLAARPSLSERREAHG